MNAVTRAHRRGSSAKTEKCEEEIVRQVRKKIMPNKLQFDHQKNKKIMNKQEESQTKGSRDTNTVKPVRCNSMERLSPTLSGDQAEESHSDESEKLQDEKRPRP